ncbi:Ubiquitin-conjugating enzyme E2 L3 [Toxocara canis]|uniref:Ubiquitin-conjugating enzyme E2 L3 n=1 Tax=Toxocara canis TaxID=6265 RepID=A0A0B2W1J8_TOXCA|nr:Ubiquitin-conjugating enzyme E2 L3 [Toxocara canis]
MASTSTAKSPEWNARLKRDLANIEGIKEKKYALKDVSDARLDKWIVVLLPDKPPFNVGGYKVELEFPKAFPFEAPKIKFLTKVYHPNVAENGEVQFPMLSAQNWKPAITVDQVLTALSDMLCTPLLGCALRKEIADLYVSDPAKFDKNAADFCKQHAEKI